MSLFALRAWQVGVHRPVDGYRDGLNEVGQANKLKKINCAELECGYATVIHLRLALR